MTKTEKDARKFREDKKEIINSLTAMIEAIRAASTPATLDDRARARGDRSANLSAKLAGAVLDYVHSR